MESSGPRPPDVPWHRPLVVFYLLAFTISWLGLWPVVIGSRGVAYFQGRFLQVLLVLPALSPALAALFAAWNWEGKDAPRKLLARLLQWRVGLRWYLVAGLGPLVLLAASAAADQILGFRSPAEPLLARPLLTAAISELIIALAANPWEEVGWRGYALPRLQQRCSDLVSTLVVGLLWGFWHIPLFFWVGHPVSNYPFAVWLAGVVGESFIYTWIFNQTRGSLLILSLFHISSNTLGAVVLSFESRGYTLVVWLVALALLAVYGPGRLGAKSGPGEK